MAQTPVSIHLRPTDSTFQDIPSRVEFGEEWSGRVSRLGDHLENSSRRVRGSFQKHDSIVSQISSEERLWKLEGPRDTLHFSKTEEKKRTYRSRRVETPPSRVAKPSFNHRSSHHLKRYVSRSPESRERHNVTASERERRACPGQDRSRGVYQKERKWGEREIGYRLGLLVWTPW